MGTVAYVIASWVASRATRVTPGGTTTLCIAIVPRVATDRTVLLDAEFGEEVANDRCVEVRIAYLPRRRRGECPRARGEARVEGIFERAIDCGEREQRKDEEARCERRRVGNREAALERSAESKRVDAYASQPKR